VPPVATVTPRTAALVSAPIRGCYAIRPYIAVLRARFQAMLQYRAAAAAGICTQSLFALILIMVYEAFYGSSTGVHPMTFQEVVGYVWLGQALFALMPWNVDPDVRLMVRTGGLVYELSRPVDVYSMWFARALAWRSASTLLRAVPIVVFAAFVLPLLGLEEWRLQLPELERGFAFLMTLTCTVALSCAITTLLNTCLLWTISADGVVTMIVALVTLLSGLIIPLPLFPDWVQRFVILLPFAGLADLTFRVYVGQIPTSDLLRVLALQLSWTLILVIAGRRFLARGMRRIVIQGG
jgi:ABC-2 type transport system permease protein